MTLPQPIKSSLKSRYFLAAFFLLLNLSIYGYEYGQNNYHDHLLPYINKLIDPSLYPNDLYMTTLPSFPSLYIYAMATLGKIVPLETAHFILYLFVKYLFFIAIYLLAEFLFKNRYTSVLSLFLFACAPLTNCFGLIGEEPLIKFLLYQSTLVVPFLLFVLYFFLQKKYFASLALLAATYYFNGLLANYVAVMLVFASLATVKEKKKIPPPLLFAWGAFFLLLLPWLYWILQKIPHASASPDFVHYLKSYYAGHYFPSSWDATKWLRALTFIAFFAVFIFQSPVDENKKTIKAFFTAIFTMWGLSFIFGEIIPLRPLIILMFFRSDIFFVAFAFLYGAHYIERMIFSSNVKNPAMGLLLIVSLIDIKLFFSPVLSAVFILFVLFLFTQKQLPYSIFSQNEKLIAIAYRGYLILLLLTCVFLMIQLPLESRTYTVLLVALGFLLLSQGKSQAPQRPPAYIAYLLLVIAALTYFDVIFYRLKTGQLDYRTAERKNWHALQLWAKDNTPQDSLFIVPPYLSGFRSFSKRPVFAEKIDEGAMHWHPGYEIKWAERLRELGYDQFPLLQFQNLNFNDPLTIKTRSIYASTSENRFVDLGKKYNADFVVAENLRNLSFPLLYKNDSFTVYKIPSP